MTKKTANKLSAKKATQFLHTTPSLFIRGAIGVILGYAFLSRALDTGSYWQYLGAVVFTILGIKLLKRSFTNNYGKVKTRQTR